MTLVRSGGFRSGSPAGAPLDSLDILEVADQEVPTRLRHNRNLGPRLVDWGYVCLREEVHGGDPAIGLSIEPEVRPASSCLIPL